MLGYTEEELKQLSYVQLTPEKWHEWEEKLVAEQIVGRGYSDVYEKEYRRKDGTIFPVELRAYLISDEDDNPVGMWGLARDVTVRKRAEEALRDREEQLRFMVEQMPAVVWTVDTDLRFTSSQGGGLHELSLFPDQVIGQDLFAYFRTDDRQFPPIAAHRRALEGESVEYEMTWTGRTFATHVEPLRDAGGRIVGCVGVGLDITERKAAEEEVRRRAEAERLLLSELDHRVRNNLSSLIALIDLMGASATNVREFAEAIRARAQTMATVHSVLSRSHWEAVRLRALLDALVPPGVRGTLRITGSDLRITASQAQALGMVINELMTNSLKHGALGAAGGAVDVSWDEAAADADASPLTLRWEESGGPPIATQPAPGFGTDLIEGLLGSELRGRAQFTYPPRGARHEFLITLDEPKTPRARAEADPATSPESG
jgi:two-component system CheB/CheR fusion protein